MPEEPEEMKKVRLAMMQREETGKEIPPDLFEVQLGRVRLCEDDLVALGISAKPLRMMMSGDSIKIQFDGELTEQEVKKLEEFMQKSPFKWRVVAAGRGKQEKVEAKNFKYARNPEFEQITVCLDCGMVSEVAEECSKCKKKNVVKQWRKKT